MFWIWNKSTIIVRIAIWLLNVSEILNLNRKKQRRKKCRKILWRWTIMTFIFKMTWGWCLISSAMVARVITEIKINMILDFINLGPDIFLQHSIVLKGLNKLKQLQKIIISTLFKNIIWNLFSLSSNMCLLCSNFNRMMQIIFSLWKINCSNFLYILRNSLNLKLSKPMNYS